MISRIIALLVLASCAVAQVPVHNLRDYGAALDGVSANSEDDDALEAAITAARSGAGSSTVWWRGPLTLRRPPPTVAGVQIQGDGILTASVLKFYPSNVAGGEVLWKVTKPAGSILGGHTALRDFSVPQAVGTPGSYTIFAQADATWAPSGIALANLRIGDGSGPGPFRAVVIDGTQRLLPAYGIREPRITNVTVFGSSASGTVWLDGTVGLFAVALRVYPAGGTYGDVYWGPGCSGSWTIGGTQ